MTTRPKPTRKFDRALLLASLNPELRRQLERTVDPTPHGFPVKAIAHAKTPVRRTHDREGR